MKQLRFPSGKSIAVVSFFLLISGWVHAQEPDSIFSYQEKKKRAMTRAIIIDGDTIPLFVLDDILLVETPSFDSEEARRRYYLLRRRVIKVYPYAVIAANKLDSLNFALSLIKKKRDQRKYIKAFQDYLENEFSDQLKQLTRSEGQILSKLIFRETGITTYQLIREHRNFMTAFWYNSLANFYEISLKQSYNPDKVVEDKLIEMILRKAFLEGHLQERRPKVFTKDDFPELTR